MSHVWWGWVVVVLLVVVFLASASRMGRLARQPWIGRSEFEAAAEQLGLARDGSFDPLERPFALFRRPAITDRTVAEFSVGPVRSRVERGEIREHHVDTVFTGMWEGSAVWIFEYAYGEGVGGTLYHDEATCAVVQLEKALPDLVIVGPPDSESSPIWGYGNAFPDGPPFDSVTVPATVPLHVYCDSEDFAGSFLDDQLVGWIETEALGAEIEGVRPVGPRHDRIGAA
jgi:hypothetical protein